MNATMPGTRATGRLETGRESTMAPRSDDASPQSGNSKGSADRNPGAANTPPRWSEKGYMRSHAVPMPAPGPIRTPASLAKTIEGEVIPRLMLALKSAASPIAALPLFVPTQEQIAELAQLSFGPTDNDSMKYVEQLHARGMSLEAIYLDLLSPAARHLNYLWAEDFCDFSDVTIGLGRLHRIVRKYSPAFRMTTADPFSHNHYFLPREKQLRAVLAPVAGEQHTFGCVMIEDFFTRAGWEVSGWPQSAENDLVEIVRSNYFDLVGLSASCDIHLPMLEQQIKAVRRTSRNRSVVIMVGGRVFIDEPKLVKAVGADMTGANGREAVTAADAAIARLIEIA
jgi:MerR family transcriptional regulator, light-induced transcriptional regulator